MTSRPLDFESSAYASSATSAGPAGMVQPASAPIPATSSEATSAVTDAILAPRPANTPRIGADVDSTWLTGAR
jgi:hypothetical protein